MQVPSALRSLVQMYKLRNNILGLSGIGRLPARNGRIPGASLRVSSGNVDRSVFSCVFMRVVDGNYLALINGSACFTLMDCP